MLTAPEVLDTDHEPFIRAAREMRADPSWFPEWVKTHKRLTGNSSNNGECVFAGGLKITVRSGTIIYSVDS